MEPSQDLLPPELVKKLCTDKDQLNEYVSAALVTSIASAIRRVDSLDVSLAQIAQFIESLRKIRNDLNGGVDGEQRSVPQMMVNIQFSTQPSALQSSVITSTPLPGKVLNG